MILPELIKNTVYIMVLNRVKTWLYRGFVKWQVKFFQKDEAEFNAGNFVFLIIILAAELPVLALSIYFNFDPSIGLIVGIIAFCIAWIPTGFDKSY